MYTFRYVCIYIYISNIYVYLCIYMCIYIYIELCLYLYINILVRILTCRHQYKMQLRTSNINIGNVNMKHASARSFAQAQYVRKVGQEILCQSIQNQQPKSNEKGPFPTKLTSLRSLIPV